MNSLENIINKITDDAQKEADQILSDAQSDCDKLTVEIKAEAESYRFSLMQKADKEASIIKERTVSRSDFEKRNSVLAIKGELIDKAFELASEQLCNLAGAKYLSMLGNLASKNCSDGSIIVLNQKDTDLYGDDVLALVKQSLPDANVSISQQVGNFLGGLVIKEGKIDKNFTFETMLKNAREAYLSDVAEVLLG